ncbi:helicase-like transcription factor [Fusarium pseudocircinatum]|uniref:Helicase-like transcription factor n=1 Tax=Fusarium pseudocircinatum TaxID=56676 RepID=A0A8H5KGN1_9HYPO|nr:helicase-like transcription factor [Fusarium pseudocircinatum]
MDVNDQDVERARKRIRLQSLERDDVDYDFGDFILPDYELSPLLPRDNNFSASISDPTAGNEDETPLELVGEPLVAETVRHVCLGTISPRTRSSFFKNRKDSEASVSLREFGGITKLSLVETGAYAGILEDSFPPDLLHRPSVKLSALLTAPASLRVIISSNIEEAAEIGTLLSNNELFLQHPSPRDIEYFELEIEYFNPHYLVTPGSRMPQLEDLAIEYNDSTSTVSTVLDEQKKGQLIGVFDTAADLYVRPTTEPSPRLKTRLKDYQLKALTVMSEKECVNVENPQCPSLWIIRDASSGGQREYSHRITGHRADVPPFCAGGILADEMGLGKTLCALSLVCWSLDSLRDTEAQWNGSEPSTTLVVIPKSMISGWQAQIQSHIMPGQIRVAVYHGAGRHSLAKHFRNNDIVLTTYQTLRSEWTNKGPLFTEKWFRVVLDEAHRIGNRSTQVFQATCELQSPRRWCLTGTPIVNSIDNYGALLAFIKMEPLDTKATFDHWISNPIRDSAQEGLRKLRILVEATCLRRTKFAIPQALPPPTVREEKVDLHPHDRALYDFFESEAAKNVNDSSDIYPASALATGREKKNVLSMIHILRRICDHGEDLLSASDIEVWKLQGRHSPSLLMMLISARQQSGTNYSTGSYHKVSPSAKVQRLIHNIRSEQANNWVESSLSSVKSVIFSYWTNMLDLVQKALLQAGFMCVRIDGQYSIKQREKALTRFASDACCTVMLATLGSGGEGIDLTSANHVHLLEPHWNPMVEEQAIARVHRMGQQRQVTVIKYITPNSVEEYVQSIQVQKTRLIQNTWRVNNDSSEIGIDNETSRKLEQWLARRRNM